MVKNELYEKEIERIAPKLEELKNRSFDEIMKGLYNEIFQSSIFKSLIFALTYILDPSRFYIEVNHNGRGYTVKFTADTPLPGDLVFKYTGLGRRPTDEEAREFIKKFLTEGFKIEGIIKKVKEVIDTCKVVQGP